MDVNGKINNKNIIVKEAVNYASHEWTGDVYFKYELICNVNKFSLENKYNIYDDIDNDISDNLWYNLPTSSENALEEISQLIYKNKEYIEIVE